MAADRPAEPTPPYVWHGVIHVGELPLNPPITRADEVMRVVSDHLGQRWQVVKLSGWWRITCPDTGVGWGAAAGQRTRDFSRALAEATGMPVAVDVPVDHKGLTS